MMIRLNSNEIRFRLSQTEVRHLLDRGSLRENVVLPSSQLSFCVKPLPDSEKVSRVSQEGEQITFWLASDDQAKLSLSPPRTDPIAVVEYILGDRKTVFSLDVDAFNAKQRGNKK